ncbi:DUF6531 domain-containing protein [Pimelobacter simplex]|uniref:DUF6531 domain-containing protein n=1 Tax=Nocardioides simplex TaxID=2045 RepID=UPI003AAB5C31
MNLPTYRAAAEVKSRPDRKSAMAAAIAQGSRVEDLSARTRSSGMFANPDGSWTLESFAGVVRSRAKSGKWVKIDPSLRRGREGLLPEAVPYEVSFGEGGSADLATAALPGGGELSVDWPARLPEPSIDGDAASYDVGGVPGDVVMTSRGEGFNFSVVLDEVPTQAAPEYRFRLELADLAGARFEEHENGSIDVIGEGRKNRRKVLATITAPMMWDAADEPAAVPVAMALEGTDQSRELVLRPDPAYLRDPERVYPVTVDPTVVLAATGDTWVQNLWPNMSQSNSTELRVGTSSLGVNQARTYLNFDLSALNGPQPAAVADAKVTLSNFETGSCSGSPIRMSQVTSAWTLTGFDWNTQPTTTATGSSANDAGHGATACAGEATVDYSATAIVRSWLSGAPNYGVQLAADNPAANASWRKFRSLENGTSTKAPKLTVTINQPPSTPTALKATPGQYGDFVTSRTPTLSATVTDPDEGQVKGYFEVSQNGAVVWSGASALAASGAVAAVEVPSGALSDGEYLISAWGEDEGGVRSVAPATRPLKVDTVAPTVSISSPQFTDGQWSAVLPASGTMSLQGTPDTGAFSFTYNGTTALVAAGANGSKDVTFTPTAGWHVVDVVPIDRAGNYGQSVRFTFGAGPGAFSTPAQWTSSVSAFPIDLSGPPSATGAKLQWRVYGQTAWNTATKVRTSTGSPWSGSVSGTGRSTTGALVWDAVLEPAGSGTVAVPSILETRGCFEYAGSADSCTSNLYLVLAAIPTPTLTIDPCLDSCSTWTTDTATPTFTAGAAVANTDVGYHFEVRDAQQVVVADGTIAPTRAADVEWTVPADTIDASGAYEIRVTATSGSASKSTAWKPFTVDLPTPPPVPVVTMTPCAGTCATWETGTATPKFTASAPVSGKEIGFRFEVRDSDEVAIADASLAPTTDTDVEWTVPVGAIPASGTFELRVTATNGDLATSTPWTSFVVNLPVPPPTVSLTPCLSGCATWSTDTATPTLTANSPKPGEPVGFRFEIRDAQQALVADKTVAPTSDPSVSWLVPVGTIKASGAYEARVTATGAGFSSDTGWTPLQVVLPVANPTTIGGDLDITGDVTWTRANSPYVVSRTVTVRPTGSLTMEPGTVVKFVNMFSGISVAGGRLKARGTANLPIVWTTVADDSILGDSNGDGAATGPVPGSYGAAVKFYDQGGKNAQGLIVNVSQRFGGWGSGVSACQSHYSGVQIADSSRVRVRRSEFLLNEKAGISVGGSADVLITGSRFAASECGVRTDGAGDVVGNVFEPGMSWGVMVITPGAEPQRIEGNWMYPGLRVLKGFARSQVDVHDNALFGSEYLDRAVGGPLDLRYNWWGRPLVSMEGCWPGTRPELDDYQPTLVAVGDLSCPWPYQRVLGYADRVMPDAGPPPFPEAGLEGSPVTQGQIEAMYGSGDGYANRGDGEQSDPVNSRSGNYVDHVTDAALPAVGYPLVLERTYNSLDPTSGVLGRGWSLTFGQRLELESPTSAVFVSEEGQRIRFTKRSDGTWKGGRNVTAKLEQDANGYTVVARGLVRFGFDNAGLLWSIRDRNGEGVQITRDTEGRVSRIANGARTLDLTYNAGGRLTTVTLPDARTVQYGYSGGLLTSVTDTWGKTTTYGYDAEGRLEWEKDPRGKRVVKLAYDAVTGRVTDQWDALDNRSQFVWDPMRQTSTVIDPRGGRWVDEYDEGVLSRRIDPLGRVWSYDYDDKLQLIAARDTRGRVTHMTYNAAGDMTTSTGANGRVETTYNSRHDPATALNAKGVTSTFAYDATGNLTGTTRTAAGMPTLTETFTVNGRGLVTSETDARGNTTTFEYNASGDLLKTTSPDGRTTTHTYDSVGRLTSTTSPAGNVAGASASVKAANTTTYTYNGNDQVATVHHPSVGTTTTVHDDAARTTSVTDPRSRTTSFTYDDAGRVLTEQGPDPSVPASVSTYDSVGNLATVTDPAGRTITYVYDLAAQITSATGPSGTFVYTYERGGKLASARRSDGGASATTNFSYDKRGLITLVNYGDPGTPDVSYTYDRHGNRSTMVDGAGTLTYSYDLYDRLTGVAQTAGSGARPTYGYGYDGNGNLVRSTGPGGDVSYAFTADGLLSKVSTTPTAPSGAPAKTLADYTYGPLGLPEHAELGNGTTWDRSYDALGRLTRVVHADSNDAVILDESYTLDDGGNPTRVTTDGGAPTERVDTYTYDTLDRLTGVCYGTSTCDNPTDYVRWTYDVVGNRTSEVRPSGTTTLTYQPSTGRLLSATGPPGTSSYSYDNYGRLTTTTRTPSGGSAETTTYAYTESSVLKSVTTGGQPESYTYDGDSRRLTTTTADGVTRFAWDPRSYALVGRATTPTAGASTSQSYQYGNGLIAFTPGDPAEATSVYSYAHADPQGSVRAVTGADGLVGRTDSWEPYGTSKASAVPDASVPKAGLGWVGESVNSDGTTHLRARTYDPAIGGFTTPDPAASTDISATYTYAGSNPMTGGDPYGLFLGGLVDVVRDMAPTVATIFGTAAMIPTPLSPLFGAIATAAGLTSAAISAHDAYNSCTGGKGSCGPAIVNAVAAGASGLPIGRGLRGTTEAANRGARFSGKFYSSEEAARRAALAYAGRHPKSCRFRGPCAAGDHYHVDKFAGTRLTHTRHYYFPKE